ncbi:hypothetical protein COCCADRAFT_24369 [Bipolaris zeicola 26-R-13]|uniref:Uncharacterized protein n=1 Tax=Cochliobolus carbonum (strain 26-R-13) TaxID=930089 RepID=W6YDG3_COCC2|nr:uncharacterized protein COCCADRAFT_24369 [Bipolaris zeicola 26-R-13]EUC35683.1 hypothetical protein COCCADRAFT_24369 [Bipolaris zeicola 26-R-13]
MPCMPACLPTCLPVWCVRGWAWVRGCSCPKRNTRPHCLNGTRCSQPGGGRTPYSPHPSLLLTTCLTHMHTFAYLLGTLAAFPAPSLWGSIESSLPLSRPVPGGFTLASREPTDAFAPRCHSTMPISGQPQGPASRQSTVSDPWARIPPMTHLWSTQRKFLPPVDCLAASASAASPRQIAASEHGRPGRREAKRRRTAHTHYRNQLPGLLTGSSAHSAYQDNNRPRDKNECHQAFPPLADQLGVSTGPVQHKASSELLGPAIQAANPSFVPELSAGSPQCPTADLPDEEMLAVKAAAGESRTWSEIWRSPPYSFQPRKFCRKIIAPLTAVNSTSWIVERP